MFLHSHLETLTDEDLLRNIVHGCNECFALLFHRYCRQVFSVSYRILRDKAETEDIVQDVFLSIYLQQERFDSTRGSIRTWILQFAYFKSLLRRRYLGVRNFYKQEELSESKEFARSPATETLGMNPTEWTRFLEAGIAKLSPKQRQVIELVHFEGHTLQEASGNLRESLANTRNYYYRGIKALRDFLHARVALKSAKEERILGKNSEYRFES